MARGYRWQLLAFLASAAIFAVVLGGRLLTPCCEELPASTTPPTETTGLNTPANNITLPTPTTEILSVQPPVTDQAEIPETDTTINQALQPSSDGISTFREGVVGQLQRLNPLLAHLNPVDADITHLIFEGLIRFNSYGEPVGGLAESWVVSSDGLEYVFRLRKNILWQDGTPFSADDVVFTLELLSDPRFPGEASFAEFWRTLEVQKLADDLVRFRLSQPLASFISRLTIGILPEHALRGTSGALLASHPFNLTPIGTGPYQLETMASSDGMAVDRISLRRAPVYQQRLESDTAGVDRIIFHIYPDTDSLLNALRTGLIDGYATDDMTSRTQVINVPGYVPYTTIAPRVGILLFNWSEPESIRFFRDQRVRTALLTGLNRVTPVETHLANRAIPADSPLLPGSWAYRSIPFPVTDANFAYSQLANARIRVSVETSDVETSDEEDEEADTTEQPAPSSSNTFYSFSILVPDNPALVSVANDIASQWRVLNLDVTVESVSQADFDTRVDEGRFQTAIFEFALGHDPDIYRYWHIGQQPDGRNYGHIADNRLSDILERARREPNGINRANLYESLQRLFIERVISIPLYYPLYTYVVRADITGVQLGFIGNTSERFDTISQWRLPSS